MRELREQDPNADRWLLVPEAAPLLFAAGLAANEKAFQLSVVRLQFALEEACLGAANPGQVLICHRGALDPLAYWLLAGWEEKAFFDDMGLGRRELLDRYQGVIHVRTAALGAERSYRRWPDAHRPETIEKAALIDDLCIRAWCGHPQRVVVDNAQRDWAGKSDFLHATLSRMAESR